MNLRNITNFKTLASYLTSELNWELGIEDFDDIDDISYDFTARDISLKPEEFIKIQSLKQLRPFYDKQPWGIFAIEFESKRLEVTSLRKILAGLIPKRRNRDHKVWDKKNLLFFCFWGEKNNRTFAAFHFEEKPNALPSIKATIPIAPKIEDPINLSQYEEKLKKLSWPDLPTNPKKEDFENWHNEWTGAFNRVYRQTIRDSHLLTQNLAGIALNIRKRILDIFSVETENGTINELYNKFKKTLIHDMTKEQFADMYAQTMVYGLFSARCMSEKFEGRFGEENFNYHGEHGEPRREYKDFKQQTPCNSAISVVKNFDPRIAIDNIPSTNPFLQNLLKESFTKKNILSFDELDLGDITLLLQNTDIKPILEDFNRQTGGGREDPVIYFYEDFLNAYEKEQKKRRGVYYTPQPVVKFIVQAVDDILKTEFGIKDGLASTGNKTITYNTKKNGKITGTKTETVPAIQILDPAVGTGTFLRQVVLQIWDNFKKANAGQTKNSINNKWNIYVKEHLLPRLNGFELMMAPYAVAHMKLALVLLDTGYAFDEDREHPDRVKVFLTNSLEEADRESGQEMMFEHDALAAESEAARATKKNRGINVVLGNPPYSGISANSGDWIASLLDVYKKEPGGIENLQEKKHWLNDDYVKFIRYAQLFIERTGSGILAYINNHSFLDNPTFRGMRWNLLKSFDKIYIIDLHGNSKKKETCPDGNKDENVFDIQQGVSINIFIKTTEDTEEHGGLAKVYHCDLYGLRDYKYEYLFKNKVNTVKWNEAEYSAPYYFFVPKSDENRSEYEEGFSVNDIFTLNVTGIVTMGDNFIIDENKKTLKDRIKKLLNNEYDKNKLDKEFSLGKNYSDWVFENIEKIKLKESKFVKLNYRPFDTRWTYFDSNLVWRLRDKVMRHFLKGENIGIVIGRQGQVVGSMLWNLVFLTSSIIDFNLYYRGGGYVFPLYLYEQQTLKNSSVNSVSSVVKNKKRRPNLNPTTIKEIEQKLDMKFTPEADEQKLCDLCASVRNSFSPIDLFDYIYAVLHSPKYRETYKEFLKIDFPRIPYPKDKEKFWKLVSLGSKLRHLHLLEGEEFETTSPTPHSPLPTPQITKIKYKDNKAYINENFFFEGVTQSVWEFYIGGYQPAQKWLKDRKGLVLKAEDIKHYKKILLALKGTAVVMSEIDGVGVV